MRFAYINDDGGRKITQFNYNQAEKRLAIDNFNGLNFSYTFDELGRKTQISI